MPDYVSGDAKGAAYLAGIHGAKGDTPGLNRAARYPTRVCELCGQRYVNPGGHAERCTGPRQLPLDPQALEPINPKDQVTRIPGMDGPCARNRAADKCLWPYCDCKF